MTLKSIKRYGVPKISALGPKIHRTGTVRRIQIRRAPWRFRLVCLYFPLVLCTLMCRYHDNPFGVNTLTSHAGRRQAGRAPKEISNFEVLLIAHVTIIIIFVLDHYTSVTAAYG